MGFKFTPQKMWEKYRQEREGGYGYTQFVAHYDYSVAEYTAPLLDQEWEERQSRKMNRLIQSAKFKDHATMFDIDYKPTGPLIGI